MRRLEKNNKALFFPLPHLVSPPPPPTHPNPLCRPARKGRPAAKAKAAGKMWRLPSGSGGSGSGGGGGVAHSFVLPEASIQTQLYDQTGPSPNQSPAHHPPTIFCFVHFNSWSLTLSHTYTHILLFSISLVHTQTQTHTPLSPLSSAHTRLARHRAKQLLPNIRQLP